jgi:predicted RNA-binding Zn-ribbon protein involved in translation (DUF1610 family)
MKEKIKRGTWGIRLWIHLFTVVLGILVFWFLGFLVEDIESIKGPEYVEVERKYVDQSLVDKIKLIKTNIADLDRQIAGKKEEQRLVGDSSQNLQRTINQILALQKLSIQKQVSLLDAEKENLSTSLKQFLEDQREYQELNKNITGLTSQKHNLAEEKSQIEQKIEAQKAPAQQEYNRLFEAHRMNLALYQLLILMPLLLISGYLLLKKRGNIYYPLFLALGGATLLKIALVMHEYFPTRYTKYVLIIGLLAAVAGILLHFIKIVAFPKLDWLMRQYREAYERFLCPVCEYPIRTGPRKFLFWTRRTVHKILPQSETATKDETYTCPSCGTTLYEQCPACQKIRHAMLIYCEHCGAKKEVP